MAGLLTLAEPMESSLSAAYSDYESALLRLKETMKAVQSTCHHPHVVEAAWMHSNYGYSFPPMRCCTRCRRWEQGRSLWGNFPILEDTDNRVVFPIDRDALYRMRLPA